MSVIFSLAFMPVETLTGTETGARHFFTLAPAQEQKGSKMIGSGSHYCATLTRKI